MKVRVKETGEIVDVKATLIEGYDVVSTDGVYFTLDQLELEQKEECLNGIKQGIKYNPDYWEKLKHQYAGMAMQGLLASGDWDECSWDVIAEDALRAVTALVEKLKNEQP